MAVEERSAFEKYIEARLQLTEFLLAKVSPKPPESVAPAKTKHAKGLGLTRAAILCILAAFLFPTAFGLGYFLHQQKRTRELELARDASNSALNQAREQAKMLAGQLEQLQKSSHTADAMVARMRAAETTRTSPTRPIPARAVPAPRNATPPRVARNHEELLQLQKRGDRTYREFALAARQRPEKIGPIGLTVLSVDQRRKSFDLSISVGSLEPTKRHVVLYEPLWIDLSGHPKTVEVVINGVNGNRVEGYLSEPKYPRMTWWQEFTEIASAMMP
jgi:hypothetical protein